MSDRLTQTGYVVKLFGEHNLFAVKHAGKRPCHQACKYHIHNYGYHHLHGLVGKGEYGMHTLYAVINGDAEHTKRSEERRVGKECL